MLTFSMASTESGKRVRMAILIGGHPLPHMDLHAVLLQIHRLDEGALHRRDQILPPAPDRVDLVGRVGVHPHQLAQLLAGDGVADAHTQQFVVEVLAVGQVGVGAADIQLLVPQVQSGVHIVHTGELHQHQALVDVVGGGGDGLALQQEGGKLREKGRVAVPGLDPDLAPDAVGPHDAAHFDGFQFHGGCLLVRI
jgi:hypothetical protein